MENLRKVRKARGESMKELGEAVGVSESAISQYETGKRQPDFEILLKLAEHYDVSVDFLLNKSEGPVSAPFKSRVPVFGSVPAGIPLEAISDIVDWEDIPVEWTNCGQEYMALKVKGDSMYPKYLEDDTVIVKITSDCESGQDCVVYVNGYDATLKKVIKKVDCIMLQPLNPTYEPKIYDYSDDVKIAGVVVEIRRKV